MAAKFPALNTIAAILKWMAIATGVVWMISTLLTVLVIPSPFLICALPIELMIATVAGSYIVTFITISKLILVWVATEHNTAQTNDLLREIIKKIPQKQEHKEHDIQSEHFKNVERRAKESLEQYERDVREKREREASQPQIKKDIGHIDTDGVLGRTRRKRP